jgi:hypothetical protein
VAAGSKPRLKYAIEALRVGAKFCGFKQVGLFGGVIFADDQAVFFLNWVAV